VSPSLDELAAAHKLRADGRVAENPTILMNIPSVLDPTMRSQDGRHILSLEVLFTPYSLPGGWPASGEPRRWFDVANKFWNPAIEPAEHEWRAMTPDIYESDFHMPRGHAPSYAASPLATLLGKSPEVSRYRSPVEGLYLSGAGTWPGAGIFGAPGRNAADAVLADLRKTKRR
jgi:phytoene dehydrogenase-like protein